MENHSYHVDDEFGTAIYRQATSRVYWFRFSRGGKQYRRPTGQTERAEAAKVARQILQGPTEQDGSGALADLVKQYLSGLAELSKHYFKQLNPVLNRFAEAFPDKAPEQITRAMIDDHLVGLEVLDATRAKYGFYIKKFYDWLVTTNRIAANRHPANELKFKKQKHSPRENWVRKAEIDSLIDGCGDIELKYILYCGFHAGLRKEEVIMSRADWFDFTIGDYGVLNVRLALDWQPKDGSPRTIPLSAEFRGFLENYLPLMKVQGPYMIAPTKPSNGALYRHDFRSKFETFVKNHVKKSGTRFTFHDARRSFASNLASLGVSIYKVAEWLGDDLDVVQKSYGRLDPTDKDLARAFERIPASNDKILKFNQQ